MTVVPVYLAFIAFLIERNVSPVVNYGLCVLRTPDTSETLGIKLVWFLDHAFLWFSAIPRGVCHTSVQHFHPLRGQSPSCSCRHLISGGTQWPPSSWQLWKLDVVSAIQRISVRPENLTLPSKPAHAQKSLGTCGSCVSKREDTKMDFGAYPSTSVKEGICDPPAWKRINGRRDIVKLWRRWMQNVCISSRWHWIKLWGMSF